MTLPPRYTRMPNNSDLSSGARTKMLAHKRHWRSGVSPETLTIYPVSDGDWQVTADTNGVAYPAGLKQVRFRNLWNSPDVDLMNAGSTIGNYIVAVPSELPAGYTATNLRFEKERLIDPSTLNPYAYMSGLPRTYGDPPGYRYSVLSSHPGQLIRTAGGLEHYDWMPENLGNLAYPSLGVGGVGGVAGFHGSTNLGGAYGATAGFRYIRFQVTPNALIHPVLYLELRRNATPADRSAPGSVLLYQAITPGTAGLWDSGVIYHDGSTNDFYSPTLGTTWDFFINVSFTPGGAMIPSSYFDSLSINYQNFKFFCGPRLDIPLPWMVTGTDHVVPGGIVTGAITGY